jgi:peptide/nickel transport system substrate-binding protein
MTIRLRSTAVVGLALTLAVTACGQSNPPAATGSAAPAAQRGAGGDLKILYWQSVTNLNTHHAQGTKDYDAGALFLEPLAHTGPDGKQVPYLAVEIPTVANGGVAKDFTSITWKLKPGVKWSDGTDFTSADVVFTWKYVTNKDSATTDSSTFDDVKSVEAVDKTTVKVSYNTVHPNIYQAFVSGLGNIIQEKQYKDFIGTKAKEGPKIPVGTGPYKVTDFKPEDTVLYAINDSYRDPKKPFFKTVTFKGVADATLAARAVCQTGEADYAWNLQVEAAVLKPMVEAADSKCRFSTSPGPNVERILINRSNPDPALGAKRSEPDQPHPFLTDLRVRKALAMAIDRGPIGALYGSGFSGQATCNIVVGHEPYTSKNTTGMDICKLDLVAANKLLDDAGATKGTDGKRSWKGKPMKILYGTTINPLRQKEQDIVKNGWTQLGIDVELKAVKGGVFFGTDSDDSAARFFADVEMFTNGSSSLDQTDYLANWTCAEIKTKADKWSGSNYERWCNKDYDALFKSLSTEIDEPKRNAIMIKMNDLLVSDVVIIPLVSRTQPSDGYNKSLKGIIPNAWDSVLWQIADWTK